MSISVQIVDRWSSRVWLIDDGISPAPELLNSEANTWECVSVIAIDPLKPLINFFWPSILPSRQIWSPFFGRVRSSGATKRCQRISKGQSWRPRTWQGEQSRSSMNKWCWTCLLLSRIMSWGFSITFMATLTTYETLYMFDAFRHPELSKRNHCTLEELVIEFIDRTAKLSLFRSRSDLELVLSSFVISNLRFAEFHRRGVPWISSEQIGVLCYFIEKYSLWRHLEIVSAIIFLLKGDIAKSKRSVLLADFRTYRAISYWCLTRMVNLANWEEI
jgi:hypothetical protein